MLKELELFEILKTPSDLSENQTSTKCRSRHQGSQAHPGNTGAVKHILAKLFSNVSDRVLLNNHSMKSFLLIQKQPI